MQKAVDKSQLERERTQSSGENSRKPRLQFDIAEDNARNSSYRRTEEYPQKNR